MRNLISIAIAFGVMLTENDVLELGYNVTEEDFKTYFEIPEDAVAGDYKKSEDFAPESLANFMNEEEAKTLEADKPAKPAKKAAAKKDAKEKAPKEEKAPKQKEAKEDKKPGVIASILEIIQNAKNPVSESEILEQLVKRFPDRTSASMLKTIKAQLGGKNQPLRMEQEKNVTFVITQTEAKEGEKSQRLYAVKK